MNRQFICNLGSNPRAPTQGVKTSKNENSKQVLSLRWLGHQKQIFKVLWCNGNTRDSKPLDPGSIPGRAQLFLEKRSAKIFWYFYF